MARVCRSAALLLVLASALALASGRGLRQEEPTTAPKVDWLSKGYKNTKPTIGILAQRCHDCPGRSYIAGGFVKWIEAAGARPVPIRYYSSEAELRRLFNSVNGLIFPGGLTDLWMDSPYVVAARKLWTWAKEANDAGEVFPIHGTCLGFQLLHILESNVSFTELLVDTDSVAHASTLQFTDDAAHSAMFGGMAPELVAKLGDPAHNISLENHMFGLPPAHYDKWPVLRDSFSMVSTALDRNGLQYVSSAEHKRYPFTATQWHPEKPPYEFGMAEVPHSLEAIRVSQHLANVFVDTARRSGHAFESPEEELNDLLYNYPSWFTLKDSVMDPSYDGPDHTYFLDRGDDEPHEGPDDGPKNKALAAAFARRHARTSDDAGLAAGMAMARVQAAKGGSAKGASQEAGLHAAASAWA